MEKEDPKKKLIKELKKKKTVREKINFLRKMVTKGIAVDKKEE